MSVHLDEEVLCLPTSLVEESGIKEGFDTKNYNRIMDLLVEPSNLVYMPRSDVEYDPSYKQIIPYCIIKHAEDYYTYKRTPKSNEARLHAKRSMGFGGHINLSDNSDENYYMAALMRELKEELIISGEFSITPFGTINDNSNDVGKVHLGVVHLVTLKGETFIGPNEDSIEEDYFCSIYSLKKYIDDYENWSKIIIGVL